MFYLAKFLQAAGLIIVLFDFLRHFPELMNFRILAVGASFFLAGWLIQHYLLKK